MTVGGYLSYQGINGTARFRGTLILEIGFHDAPYEEPATGQGSD